MKDICNIEYKYDFSEWTKSKRNYSKMLFTIKKTIVVECYLIIMYIRLYSSIDTLVLN